MQKTDNPPRRGWSSILLTFAFILGVALVLCRIAWLILAAAIADHQVASDPKTALLWRPNTSLALLSLAQMHFVRGSLTPLDWPEESIVFKRRRRSELLLRRGDVELGPVRPEGVLLQRGGEPVVGDVASVARWIDLHASKSFYARAAAGVSNPAVQDDVMDSLARLDRRRRSSPAAIRYVAEHAIANLVEEDRSAAKSLAQRSLVSDPLQQSALVLLSDIAAREGNWARSIDLLRLAGTRSYRDATSQARLLDLSIAFGDYPAAMARADALMHVGGKIQYLVREFLTTAAMDDRSYLALVEVLAGAPPWRQSLITNLSAYGDADSGLRLLSELAERQKALQVTDVAPVLQLLMKQKQTVEAYLAWVRFLPDPKKQKAGYVFDGGFTEEPSNIPFEWNVSEFPKGSIGFVRSGNLGAERTLRIEFVGARDPKLSVYQFMSLSPGRYRLKMEGATDNLRVARGVVWRISCLGKNERILAETEPVRGSTQWREIETDFELPSDACDFPMLRLVLKAKTAPELVANGVAYFRRIQLIRRGTISDGKRESIVKG